MRKYIAWLLFWVIMRPIGIICDWLFPEGTESQIVVWLDEKDNTKIRFQLRSHFAGMDSSVGMKITEWRILCDKINAELNWRNQ